MLTLLGKCESRGICIVTLNMSRIESDQAIRRPAHKSHCCSISQSSTASYNRYRVE